MSRDGDRGAAAPRGIDAERVTAWLCANLEGVEPPLAFSLIAGGHSNLTYRVSDATGKLYVLRRPPLGSVLATAHDMAREHRIISALRASAVPVPPALALCEDAGVNDAPFYVMAHVAGRVIIDSATAREYLEEPQRRRLGEDVVDVLAALHTTPPDAVGLGDLGRRENYLSRQLARWRKQWESSKTRELPTMETVYEALRDRMPKQHGAAIVHGDYRLGNMIVGPEGRIAALLDWELCTLGDPLADLGYLLNDWADAGERGPTARTAPSPSAAGGFPTREQVAARYAELTGSDVSQIAYYRAFQYWRLAAIVEGVLSRYLKGVMGHRGEPDAFRAQVDGLAAAAEEVIRQGGAG